MEYAKLILVGLITGEMAVSFVQSRNGQYIKAIYRMCWVLALLLILLN